MARRDRARSDFDQALTPVRALADEHPIALINSVNQSASKDGRRAPSRSW
jgi:hypothetical protein